MDTHTHALIYPNLYLILCLHICICLRVCIFVYNFICVFLCLYYLYASQPTSRSRSISTGLYFYICNQILHLHLSSMAIYTYMCILYDIYIYLYICLHHWASITPSRKPFECFPTRSALNLPSDMTPKPRISVVAQVVSTYCCHYFRLS